MSWHFLQEQEAASWEGISFDNDAGRNQCAEELAPNVAPEELREEKQVGGAVNCSDSELCTFLLGLEEGYLPTYYSDTSPSVQSKLMSIASRYYQRGKKMVVFHGFPSLRMSRNLMVSRGAAESMSCQEASHARTSAPPAKGPGLTEGEADYGEKWPASLTKYDRSSRLWRTRQFSLLGGLEEFSGTWPKWGIMQHGECLGVNTSGCLITGKEFGSLLPTIVHNEGLSFLGGPLRSAETWMNTDRLSHRLIGLWKGWQQRENNARTKMKIACHPTFAEQLMGWPEMWTDLNGSGMGKYRQWLRSHGGCCHDDVSLPNAPLEGRG